MTSPLATPGPWDLVASAYSIEVVPQFEHFSREAMRLAAPAKGSRIVDVACGPGTLSTLAAAAGHDVSAIDFSTKMVDELRGRIAQEPFASKIDVRVGDGMELPYSEGSFDAAFSMFGLMFFPDRDRGFRELLRVLKPGAPAVISSWLPLDRVVVLAAAVAAMNEVIPPPPNTPPFKPALGTREACIAEMTAAGFRDVTVHEITYETPPEPVSEIWASLTRTNAPIGLRKVALGDRWPEIERAIAERLLAKLGEGPLPISMPAFLTVGRR